MGKKHIEDSGLQPQIVAMSERYRRKGLQEVHQLVGAHGAAGAVVHAQNAVSLRPPELQPDLLDILAGPTGRRIADTAARTAFREIEGGDLGYSYSAWCLTGLPHRDRPAGDDWLIKTDYARLLVRPGVRIMDDDSRVPLSVPSGTFARLLLIDWQSEAYDRNSREITLGKSPGELLSRMGLSRGGPVSRKITDQAERLATCSVTFRFGDDNEGAVLNERLVEAFDYVSSSDVDVRTKRPARMIRRVLLSEAFFRELKRHPVLIDRAAIREIQASPKAIDLYLWLAFRLHAIQDEVHVSWSALWKQFGREVATLRSFRAEIRDPLMLALASYSSARVEQTERGLVLHRSPPPIAA